MGEIRLTTLTAGPFQTNCYIIWDSETYKAAVIDPGGARDEIIEAAQSNGLKVEWVLLTHGHLDHAFYAGDIAEHFGARIGAHEDDAPDLNDTVGIAAIFYDVASYVRFDISDPLSDGDVITLGNSSIEIMYTPGHAQGGLCFMTDAGVFCGDTVFAGSIGRTDLPGGDYAQLMSSIREKILTLKDEVTLHPGHGPSTMVGIERQRNEYLQ